MKLTTLLVAASCFTAQAFSPQSSTKSPVNNAAINSPLRKQAPSTTSVLFRDPSLTRGGAVPGWAAYNEALDKNPITAKACTSFVGFFLGDLLAQVGAVLSLFITFSSDSFKSEGNSLKIIFAINSYLLPRDHLMSSVLSFSQSSDSFTTDLQDTSSTTGWTLRSQEPKQSQYSQRSSSIRYSGAQFLWPYFSVTLDLLMVMVWQQLAIRSRQIFSLLSKVLGRFGPQFTLLTSNLFPISTACCSSTDSKSHLICSFPSLVRNKWLLLMALPRIAIDECPHRVFSTVLTTMLIEK